MQQSHHEPVHQCSATDRVLTELQLYDHRAFADGPDPRPLPEASKLAGSLADIFDALVSSLADTRLEADLEDLLWSTVNTFQRAIGRVERELDDNEQSQHRSQREQDGSEVKSVELEDLIAQGRTHLERREAFELMRDVAAELFETHLHTPWRPRTGSVVNHRTMTAALIDSRDFVAAKRRAETEIHLPPGPCVAFSGGDCSDPVVIWEKLDKIRTKHAKAAPFKRNDRMLEQMPIGVVLFPGTGIQDNLADKARKLGIPVLRIETGGA